MSSNSITANRHLRLLDLLKRRGPSRVDELSELLGVSPVTIRRDLDLLSRQELLERTHGGARLKPTPINGMPERDFQEKGGRMAAEKQAIAAKAVELLHDNEIVFINSGSTTLSFIENLGNRNLKAFTNNAWAITANKSPGIELMVLGGEYREQSRSLVGIMTLEALENIHSNKTFLGTNGISLEKGLTTTVQQECSINQAMVRNTNGPVIVLADHTKIGRISNFVSTPLEDVDIIITDSGCPKEDVEQLLAQGINVIIAEVEPFMSA